MKIIFMGTPDFAVPCLKAIIDSKNELQAVFAQPDKPKGRHGALSMPPVKEEALKHGIPVYQPKTLRDGEAEKAIKALSPDLIVVTAYGKILPGSILEIPKYGCINIHASLLPLLRGAAPIQWSIINGFEKTGVTAMQMDEGLDTGDIILQKECDILPCDNSETLFERLSALGAIALLETLSLIEGGSVTRIKQNSALSTYAPVLSKENSPLDFSLTALQIHNRVRGMYPWPGSTAEICGIKTKILKTSLTDLTGDAPGEFTKEGKRLFATCGDLKKIEIISLQPENKKAMSALDFLNGMGRNI